MNDLDTAMKDVAEHVDVPAHFTAAVLRGGKRRQARRRRAVAAAVVAVIGVTGVGVSAVQQYSASSDSRLAAATRGDLAGDRELAKKAIEVWQDAMTPLKKQDMAIESMIDDPHAVWAGSTQAGNAVVVVQEAMIAGKPQTLRGLVVTDPLDGGTKLVSESRLKGPNKFASIFLFGPGDRTFLAFSESGPIYVSSTSDRNGGGQVMRVWTRLPANGGAAVWTAPDGVDLTEVRLVAYPDVHITQSTSERLPGDFQASSYMSVGLTEEFVPWQDVVPSGGLGPDDTGRVLEVSPAGSGVPVVTPTR